MRALVTSTDGGEDYDFEVLAVPFENGQVNYNYDNGEYYNQILVPSSEATRAARLESGLPLFDNHPWDKAATQQLGISRGYEFTAEGLKLKIKLGSRADEALRNDIKSGIVKTVSIEGDIYAYEVTRNMGELPVYRTTDWEPTSVSLAPVPQDIKSQIEVQRAINEQIKIKPVETAGLIKSITNKF